MDTTRQTDGAHTKRATLGNASTMSRKSSGTKPAKPKALRARAKVAKKPIPALQRGEPMPPAAFVGADLLLPPGALETLDLYADALGVTRSAFVAGLIEKYAPTLKHLGMPQETPSSGAPQRQYVVTLTKRAAGRLRDFVRLYNVEPEDTLAVMAGEQLVALDDDKGFEAELGRLAVGFGVQRKATLKCESQPGGAK
jgi:hypothetical protein